MFVHTVEAFSRSGTGPVTWSMDAISVKMCYYMSDHRCRLALVDQNSLRRWICLLHAQWGLKNGNEYTTLGDRSTRTICVKLIISMATRRCSMITHMMLELLHSELWLGCDWLWSRKDGNELKRGYGIHTNCLLHIRYNGMMVHATAVGKEEGGIGSLFF